MRNPSIMRKAYPKHSRDGGDNNNNNNINEEGDDGHSLSTAPEPPSLRVRPPYSMQPGAYRMTTENGIARWVNTATSYEEEDDGDTYYLNYHSDEEEEATVFDNDVHVVPDDDCENNPQNEALRYRHTASNLVREHLKHHVAHNPGASSDYVTWIATLHPENAQITIDERFLVPGNPWWTIYEETMAAQSPSNQTRPVPTATPVPMERDNRDDAQKRREFRTEDHRAAAAVAARGASPLYQRPREAHTDKRKDPRAKKRPNFMTWPARLWSGY